MNQNEHHERMFRGTNSSCPPTTAHVLRNLRYMVPSTLSGAAPPSSTVYVAPKRLERLALHLRRLLSARAPPVLRARAPSAMASHSGEGRRKCLKSDLRGLRSHGGDLGRTASRAARVAAILGKAATFTLGAELLAAALARVQLSGATSFSATLERRRSGRRECGE